MVLSVATSSERSTSTSARSTVLRIYTNNTQKHSNIDERGRDKAHTLTLPASSSEGPKTTENGICSASQCWNTSSSLALRLYDVCRGDTQGSHTTCTSTDRQTQRKRVRERETHLTVVLMPASQSMVQRAMRSSTMPWPHATTTCVYMCYESMPRRLHACIQTSVDRKVCPFSSACSCRKTCQQTRMHMQQHSDLHDGKEALHAKRHAHTWDFAALGV